MSKHPASISMLFIFMMSFIFQGCVVHHGNHRTHSRHKSRVVAPAPITFTFTDHHRRTVHNFYHQHPRHHGKKHAWNRGWKHKKNSHLHSTIQMHVLPDDLVRQLPRAPRGTRYVYVDDQLLLINVKTRRVLDFINISVSKPDPRTVDRVPSYGEQHPTHQPPSHTRAYEVAQGKPFTEEHPSDHAKMDKKNRGGSQQSDHGPQSGQKDGPQKDQGRPGRGKPSMDSPMADDSGAHQMAAKGKPDRRELKGRGKQKDMFAESSSQEDSSVQPSSRSKNRGKPSKQDYGPARGPSGQEETEQFQPEPEENIQVAKVERGRGTGNSKGASKTDKMKRGKREQQTDTTAVVTQQEPTPNRVTPKPTTTASIAPSSFDSNQRSIIQNYYQNFGSKKSGKGRGKKSRGSKTNKTPSVSKNDILTQSTEPLPRSLESQLPPPPPNAQRVLYNQQVLLIEIGTHKVLDVININN